jgi:putative flippase GtrA
VRLSRFTVVGALCAVLSNAAVIALVRHGVGSLLASVLAFGPVLIVGYALHAAFTFGTQPSRVTFVRYTLATAANFPVWAALLFLFGDVLHVSITLLAPAATLLIFLWNYLATHWAFTPQPLGRRLS